ncbi:putative F-box protein At3g29830 isoform X1 [Lycium barbarum]|uniref:putative F-box protein At3g29830 isoform X1 n=1 Tax=Lycium barbarum TaxID=112863 RepID=UPI00293F0AF5|nr:putative F-box protein At3g29830 isoform X1 [Lycium barbarum]
MELLDVGACGAAVKKCKVSEFGEEDRISCIPDPVLAYIMSFLSTKDAVKTMLLKPFGKLWTTRSNLDFYVCLFEELPTTPPMNRWFSFVDHVLLHHEAPTVTQFRLKFGRTIYSSGLESGKIVEKIDSWINFAVRKKVEVLEVDIGRRCRYEPIFDYHLPSFILRSDTLTELNLASCSLATEVGIQMKSLKTLSLGTILLDDTFMEEMLAGCPSLETLIINDCQGLHLLKLPHHVKDLKITLDESEMSLLEIIAPKLNSISVSGAIDFVNLKVPSSLSAAALNFFRGGKSFISRQRNIWLLLSDIKHAVQLRVCHWCVLELAVREWNGCLSLTRKSVVVETKPTRWHFLGIVSLLRNSPKLEVLTVFIESDTFLFTWDDIRHETLGKLPSSQMQRTMKFNEICCQLKIVNIQVHIVNSFAIQLVKFLLRSSNCLEQVVISIEGRGQGNQLSEYHIEKSMRLYEELSHCPRASKKVIIRLRGLKC